MKEFIDRFIPKIPKEEVILETTFTKQHFQAMAKAIKDAKTKEEMAKMMIDIFAKANPRFDEERFKKAAGL